MMDIREFFALLRRGWVLLTALSLLGVASAVLLSLIQTPLYEANSKVYVSVQSATTVTDLSQGGDFLQQVVKSYADVATTPIVLNRVIQQLDLNTSAAELAKSVSADAPANTVVINIAAQDPQPRRAAEIANAVSADLADVVQTLTPANSGSESSPIRLTLIQAATTPVSPVSPRLVLNIVLGLLVGLVVATSILVVRKVSDVKVRVPQDVTNITDKPVLGVIAFDSTARDEPLIVHANPTSTRAEAFRSLRTKLQFLGVDSRAGAKTWVITSSLASEGKTTSGANLALTISDAGSSVLIVDADLRRPRLDDYFGVEGSVGLTDVLAGQARVEDAIQTWGANRLSILPAGQIPPNPSELLQSRQMAELMTQFAESFDVVIYDAPPLLPVSDAAIVGERTDGAIVINASGRVTRHQLRAALALLDQTNVKVLGLVMTMLPTRGAAAYGYEYGYGYGYGYSSVPSGPKS